MTSCFNPSHPDPCPRCAVCFVYARSSVLCLVRRPRTPSHEMRIQNNSGAARTNLPCREHPALCVSLFTFMFVPAIAGEVALGRLLTQLIPHPGLFAILGLAPAFVVLFVIGMLFGATIWLLLLKRFVPRNVLATFFLAGPNVPGFSKICAKIFAWSYSENSPGPEP